MSTKKKICLSIGRYFIKIGEYLQSDITKMGFIRKNIWKKHGNQTKNNKFYRDLFIDQFIPKGGIGAELGVFKGGFTRRLLEISESEKLHLIDPWYTLGKEWKWARGNKSTIDALISIFRVFEDKLIEGQLVISIGDDLEILPTFPDEYFDWVYIDSTHQYEHTRKELNILKQKVKEKGVIAGDDWQVDPSHRHHGVYQAVNEFINYEPYQVIYSSKTDHQWAIRRDDRF